MTPRRLTRKERQAHTRACLLESAAKVFARRGLQEASVDEVAEEAGFTKGAVYANFESKEQLFLEMLDVKFAERVRELEGLLDEEGEAPESQAEAAGLRFVEYLNTDPEWQRLFLESRAHAVRNPGFRRELTKRYRRLREGLADLLARRAQQLDVEPPIPLDRVAMMLFMLANGYALERLVEPEAVDDELYGETLMVLFTGLRTLAGIPAEAEPAGAAATRR
jgi:AcrR family transcriptional regulator